MFSTISSAAVLGIDAYPVQVEADISDGLPSFCMVGDLAAPVREAADRVRTALKNNGIGFPPKKVTVNLSPAHIRKEGTRFDLPIAAALLTALNIVPQEAARGVLIVGEIGLNGQIRPVRGVLQTIMLAKERHLRRCIVPRANAAEGAVIQGIEVAGVETLQELLDCLLRPEDYPLEKNEDFREKENSYQEDFKEVAGQEHVRRAAEIAAAGMHNFLMIGSPGSGKTMIARRMPGILPQLTLEEALEITRVYSACGLLPAGEALASRRPFRAPHHTISAYALAGGGRNVMPGEISLATRGVLFLDELPEFSRNALEVLRQPLESGEVLISRTERKYSFPAHFQLVAAMNPCKCGYFPDRNKCRCLPGEIHRYLHRISRPLLDRIDICTEIPKVEYQTLAQTKSCESSASIRSRVERAQKKQQARYRDTGFSFNRDLNAEALKTFCPLGEEEKKIMEAAFERLDLSARAYHRIIKVARTIADLEEEERIREPHLLEAIGYRSVDQKFWSVDTW